MPILSWSCRFHAPADWKCSMATLVDSHVHLDRYTDEEVTAMVSRGAAAGVTRLLTIGVDLATSQAALRLAERHPEILAAVGIHPTRLFTPRLRGVAAHEP